MATSNGSVNGSTNGADVVIDCSIRELYYGSFKAVRDTAIPVKKNTITAFIGPSGCGKSTVLRCLNRMNDLVRGFRFEGHVRFRGKDIYASAIDWRTNCLIASRFDPRPATQCSGCMSG